MKSTNEWDEPATASSPRGWYWPRSTKRGETACAGHYLDYGPDHRRFDSRQTDQPGTIHCVVIDKETGNPVFWRHCTTVEQARSWIEEEAAKHGHAAPAACPLSRIAAGYRTMPHGRACLQVLEDGAISNGIAIVARCGDADAAKAKLVNAGFVEVGGGWKLRPSTTQLQAAMV